MRAGLGVAAAPWSTSPCRGRGRAGSSRSPARPRARSCAGRSARSRGAARRSCVGADEELGHVSGVGALRTRRGARSRATSGRVERRPAVRGVVRVARGARRARPRSRRARRPRPPRPSRSLRRRPQRPRRGRGLRGSLAQRGPDGVARGRGARRSTGRRRPWPPCAPRRRPREAAALGRPRAPRLFVDALADRGPAVIAERRAFAASTLDVRARAPRLPRVGPEDALLREVLPEAPERIAVAHARSRKVSSSASTPKSLPTKRAHERRRGEERLAHRLGAHPLPPCRRGTRRSARDRPAPRREPRLELRVEIGQARRVEQVAERKPGEAERAVRAGGLVGGGGASRGARFDHGRDAVLGRVMCITRHSRTRVNLGRNWREGEPVLVQVAHSTAARAVCQKARA